MEDKARIIYGNLTGRKAYRNALHSKQKFVKRFGDDTGRDYSVDVKKNEHIGDLLGVYDVRIGDRGEDSSLSRTNENLNSASENLSCTSANLSRVSENLSRTSGEADSSADIISADGMSEAQNVAEKGFDLNKGLIVGNIRMGFGHYRISMAIASAANALGYVPYWMDLNSYKDTTCTKVISAQNELYSFGSRISQRSRLFNMLVWEPMNYEGFRKLSYNASDQKNAELMATVYKNIPKSIPVVATHVWPAQAAIHAGMKRVVNAVPDNWPMALHLSEGSIHTVQTHFAYQGYRILNGMCGKRVLNPMPAKALAYTGHYVDHELVSNIEADCEARRRRKRDGEPMRFLLTIGGAGAQREIFAGIISYLLPYIRQNRAALYVNVGDYRNVWDELVGTIPSMKELSVEHFDEWDDTRKFAADAINGDVKGIHGFYHRNIFEAVYCTNLLMRSADVLVTKPSELAFYPIPKLFIKRVGGHEQWGAIHSAEIGDGTLECRDIAHTLQMINLFLREDTLLLDMCDNIEKNKQAGVYNGAYEAVKIAMQRK